MRTSFLLGLLTVGFFSMLVITGCGNAGPFADENDKMTRFLYKAENWDIRSVLIEERVDSAGWGQYEVGWDTTLGNVGTFVFKKELGNKVGGRQGSIQEGNTGSIPLEYDAHGGQVGTGKGTPNLYITFSKTWRHYEATKEIEHTVSKWEKNHFIFESDIPLGGNPAVRMRYRFDITAQ